MTITVDRIEGDIAVVEFGDTRVEIPVSALPPGAGEGSVLRFELDEAARETHLDEAEARLERLRARTSQDDDVIDL